MRAWVLAGVLALAAGPAMAQEKAVILPNGKTWTYDAEQGKEIMRTCAACHGEYGEGGGGGVYPRLAGLNGEYLAEELRAFKTRSREYIPMIPYANERELPEKFLFAGAEESGPRGSRAHISRLSVEERAAVEMAVNIDTVGVVFSRNCVTNDIGDPEVLKQVVNVAGELNADLGQESDIVTDYIPFKGTDAWHDFLLGLQFNYVGGVLPQRSWFTDPFSVPVVNFTACGLTEDPWSDLVSMLFFPIGKMHGVQDRLDQVDIPRLYEQFQIAREFLGIRDRRAAEPALTFSQQ